MIRKGPISSWNTLFLIGAIAALLAAVLIRRNIGAEVSLFTGVEAIPASALGWYELLQANPFISLSFLAVFDLTHYALEGLVFLALGAGLWQANKSLTSVALASGMVGITVSLATNISLSMLSLSQRYASAGSEAQKLALLAAGEAILATNDPLAAFPGTGAYMGLLLIALAGVLYSLILLAPHRLTAIVGLLACGFDLVYCLAFPLTPVLPVYLLLAAAGLLWMIWHLLVARILFGLTKGVEFLVADQSQ